MRQQWRQLRDTFTSGTLFAVCLDVNGLSKRFVYVLRSIHDSPRTYVGLTSQVQARLAAHNAGRSRHTSRYRPWRLVVTVEFADEDTAVRFERYPKSGSGHAFARRHFL